MKLKIIPLALSLALLPGIASACPKVSGLPDYNCDGEIVVSIIGDSFVTGTGDTKNGNKGGYVLRASRKLPAIEFQNLGIAGLHTGVYISKLGKAFKGDSDNALRTALNRSDFVILDVGRNDRWEFGLPSGTLRNLKRIASMIKSNVELDGNVPPLVITAVLMLPNRGSQGPWVAELNALILKINRTATPADLRFDLVSKRLLGTDQIHPTSEGYDALAAVFVKYLQKSLPVKVAKLRPDLDLDGVYDFFETLRFGTDPALPDTDGDTQSDGAELFQLNTNPLVADGPA